MGSIIYMYLKYPHAMKLQSFFMGMAARVPAPKWCQSQLLCLGSCEPAGPCPSWIDLCLIGGVSGWFEVSCALQAHLAGEVQGNAELAPHSLSWPLWALTGAGCAGSPGPAMEAVGELICEGSWWGLYVLICGTGQLEREKNQLQKQNSWLICWFVLSISL